MTQRSELIKKVTTLWKEGQLSAAQIGTETGLTRNAVMGLVWRQKKAGHDLSRPEVETEVEAESANDSAVRVCAVEGCGRPHSARGWCRSHYEAVRRYGSPVPSREQLRGAVGARFLTDADKAQIDRLEDEGHKAVDIGRAIGVHTSVVAHMIFRDPARVAARAAAREEKRALSHLDYIPVRSLAEEIAMPGIDKHLLPLCLYKGTRSFGRIHRWWNFALAAMETGCDDLTDVVKLSHNPAFSQLCGPSRKPELWQARSFFNRLRLNPAVTDNVPEFTGWVEHMLPRPFELVPVPLESLRGDRMAPWRVFRPRRKARKERGANIATANASACYPFIAHDAKRSTGADLVAKVNKAVPRHLPEEFRADVCQDIILAILTGEMKEEAALCIKRTKA